jgi:hypothetical protein
MDSIVAWRDALNIKFVIHMGDITNKNNSEGVDEWLNAHNAHRILDRAGIPYSVMPGNHDYYPKVESEDRLRRDTRKFNERFGPSEPRFRGKPWYGGHFGTGNENNYTLFNQGSLEFIVVSLEYAPRKDASCWAGRVLEQHAQRRAIVATHCYQGHGGDHVLDCGIRDNLIGANGRVLWQELVRPHPNVFLVLSGHIGDSEHKVRLREGEGSGARAVADTVHEILTDYQFERNALDQKNGNGWLRTLTFQPAANRVDVDVKSVLGVDSFNRGAYEHDPSHSDHKYSFNYNMSASPPVFGPAPAALNRFADRTINSDDTRNQRAPDIAMANNGNWVAVWQDDSHGAAGTYQIYARGFDPNGCERFHDRTVNVGATGQQRRPAIAMRPNGDFVVVWEDDVNQNGRYQIKARGFRADGTQLFAQRTINATAAGQQLRPAVAMDPAGNFVVVWQDDHNNNGIYQIKARGFDAGGAPRIAQFTVNTTSQGRQLSPDIAMRPNGDFVVVWEDDGNQNGFYQIRARGFNANGNQLFPRLTVNTDADGQQRSPSVGMHASGRFVVVWQDDSNDNEIYQIKGRGFDAVGNQRIQQFTVNANAAGQQLHPDVHVDSDGTFVVTWEDDTNENGNYQIKARGFNDQGGVLMDQLTVNHNARGDQLAPAIALRNGNFVVIWEDDLEKNGSWEILGVGCSVSAGCRY